MGRWFFEEVFYWWRTKPGFGKPKEKFPNRENIIHGLLVRPGDGFSAEKLAKLQVHCKVNGVKLG
jgi:hypothetical protein